MLPHYNPPPRGFTENPLVRLLSIVAIALWWRSTYAQEPVYGRLLRRAGAYGAVVLVGTISLVIGVDRNVWWLVIWALSIPLFLYNLWAVSERSAYNQQYLAEAEENAAVEEIIAEQEEFARQEERTRAAEWEMAERRILGQALSAEKLAEDKPKVVRIGDQEIDVEEFNRRNDTPARRRSLEGRGL